MEESDAQDTTQETLTKQFQTVNTLTDRSEVMQWGDVTFTEDKVSEYIGGYDPTTVKMCRHPAATGAVSARHADLGRLYFIYSSASTHAERLAAEKELQAELAKQVAVDTVYTRFLELVYLNDAVKQDSARTQNVMADLKDCEVAKHQAPHGARR